MEKRWVLLGLSIEVGCFVEKREIAGQAGNGDNDMDVIPKPSVAVDSTAEAEFFSGGRVAECDAEGVQMQTTGFGRMHDASGVNIIGLLRLLFRLLPCRLSGIDGIAAVEQVTENRSAKSEGVSGMHSQLMCTACNRVKQHIRRSVAVY